MPLFVVGQANTPHHADKTPPLLPPNERPEAFFDSLEAADVDVCGVNEMWPGILREALARPDWEGVMPFPNNRRPMLLGNGFVWGNDIARKQPAREVRQRIDTGSGPRDIHLPLIRFRPLGQRQVVPILNVHAPRMKDDSAGNRRTHAAAIAKAQKVTRRTGRCLVLGDPNGPVAALYRAAGAQCEQEETGFIAAFGDVRLVDFREIREGVLKKWGDHLLLVADVVIK